MAGRSGMRVAITGATGNVGTSLIEALAEDDQVEAITGIARRAPAWHPPKTTWWTADVATDDLVPAFLGADAIVHLAWIFQPTHDPVATWRSNVLGSIRVFEAAARAGVTTLIHASSVGAYSPGPKDSPVAESWPTHSHPTAAYGREKAYLERVLDTFETQHPGMRVVRLRPAFIFKRSSASSQRRLFAGPFLPGRLIRPGLIPIVPDVPGLRFQALHSRDAAEAYRRALHTDVRGAFNVASDPVIGPRELGELLGARPVRIPAGALRAAVAAAWHLHLVPASPMLLDLALRLPTMDASRAHIDLGWSPTVSATDALAELFEGMRTGAGGPTPPLRPDEPLRADEVATGVGERSTPGA